jgi:membrane protease YdiL (CAAX protease family)
LSEKAGSTEARAAPLLAIVYVAWLLAAWIVAWLAFEWGEAHIPWLTTGGGSFAYWTVLKVLVWLAPALWLIRASRRTIVDAFGLNRLGVTLAWGLGAGIVLAAINVVVRGSTTLYFDPSWALLNAALVAPAVEEAAFRGAVLGALSTRFSFAIANTSTAALFVLAHVPGWFFQGRLLEMISAPIGGALSIFVLGWLFGWIAYKARSVGAATIAHALNNFTSIG